MFKHYVAPVIATLIWEWRLGKTKWGSTIGIVSETLAILVVFVIVGFKQACTRKAK